MEFFAVVVDKSYTVPGDERSRTCPGHGYPEHSVNYKEFIEFNSEADFRAWVEREETRAFGKTTYRAIACRPVKVSTRVEIDIA